MINKRKIKAFFTFNWVFVLLIYLASFVGFYYLYDILNNPSYDEKISVFISINYLDKNKMEDDFYANYNDTTIKEISIDYSNPDSIYYATIFNTRGLVNTDILILSSASMASSNYSKYFVSLDENVISSYTKTTLSYTTSNSLNYGICVNDMLSKYVEDELTDDYYLFFNKKSTKLGTLIENSENDYALKLLASI